MAKTDCEASEEMKAALDKKIKKLHPNQAPPGRHKCVYCAYEEGYKDGYKRAQQDLLRNLFKNA